MIKPRLTENLRGWMTAHWEDSGFQEFLQLIRDDRDSRVQAALNPGDTEFAKGETAALNRVLALPEQVLKRTGGDTKDTPPQGE